VSSRHGTAVVHGKMKGSRTKRRERVPPFLVKESASPSIFPHLIKDGDHGLMPPPSCGMLPSPPLPLSFPPCPPSYPLLWSWWVPPSIQ
jgi:hypothetical protein